MSKQYSEVIDILGGNDFVDYQYIALELAKLQPSLFLKIHKKEHKDKYSKNFWNLSSNEIIEINAYLANNQVIGAIKALRTMTMGKEFPHGLSLKDAKDVIDVVRGAASSNWTGEQKRINLQALVDQLKS